jgi:uncharacterized protein involved in type VI secretion and phage assembly
MASLQDLIRSLFQKRWTGVYRLRVVSNQDASGLGRVRVSLPAPYTDNGEPGEAWAQIATLMAGNNRGTWFIPDPGDEVLVAFEGGDPRRPYVIGALWSAENPPPEQMDSAGQNPVKSIHSRNGITVSLYDLDGDETLALKTPGGQSVTLRDGDGGSLEIQDANGNQIRLSATGLQVLSSAKVTVNASQVELSAGSVTVNSGMSTFSGTIKADTVITNSVISASYTPGAGNVM